MKEYISAGDLAIWIALIVGQIVLCLCSFKRRLFRRLPWFSLYVFVSAAESLLLFAIAFLASYTTYYHVFYLTGRLISVLAFLTLIEFARQVLPGLNLPQKEKALLLLFAALGCVVLFASLWPQTATATGISCGPVLDPNFTAPVATMNPPGPCDQPPGGDTQFTADPGNDQDCEPIIIDVEGHGFQLTNTVNGVVFDIRADR